MKSSKGILPWEGLYRAASAVALPTYELRTVRVDESAKDAGTADGRTIELQWSVFDRWTEIDSWFEGNFMERIAPGAFTKTISENRDNMRILLQHGRDPMLGQKPIASIDRLEENEVGGYAEGRLFDGLDPLVVSGLRAGQYGASFAFRVLRDEFVNEPKASEYNPNGLPERTIREVAVSEFGPVTWGAYSEASAGVRSLTDEMLFGELRSMPQERLADLSAFWRSVEDRKRSVDDRVARALDAPPADDDSGHRSDASSDDEAGSRVQESAAADDDKQDKQYPTAPAEATRKGDRYLSRRVAAPRWRL